jgi:hypothetical protein
MLLQIETAIEHKLAQILAEAETRMAVFPDNPRDFGHAVAQQQVLVGYKRSLFEDISEQPLQQVETLEFEITIQTPNIRTHQGAYMVLDLIRFGLLGFMPVTGALRGMRPVGARLVDFDPKEGVWVYAQTWQFAVTVAEGDHPDEDYLERLRLKPLKTSHCRPIGHRWPPRWKTSAPPKATTGRRSSIVAPPLPSTLRRSTKRKASCTQRCGGTCPTSAPT